MPVNDHPRLLFGAALSAHLLAGLAVTWWIRNFASSDGYPVLLGLVLAQMGFVAIWAAFSTASPARRFAGALDTSVVLWAEMQTAAEGWQDWRQFLRMGTEAALAIYAPLIAISIGAVIPRRRGIRLDHMNQPSMMALDDGAQFAVKHLLGLTAAVAVFLTVVRGLRGLGISFSLITNLLLAIVIGGIFSVSALATAWAVLGGARWLWRLPVPFVLAAGGGALLGYSLGDVWQRTAIMVAVAEGQVAIIVATLLAVRMAGYRLVREQGSGLSGHVWSFDEMVLKG